jgi:hypothetical protein
MSTSRMRLILLSAITVGWLVLACSASDLVPVRQARITNTPTRTPKPTFTPAATATNTLVPSPTPSPSHTPTVTPVPTDTPLPTDTPAPTLTPSITPTPQPTVPPTATRRPPTPRPPNTPVPQPTKTPAPPFSVSIVRGYPHCGGYAGVTGYVKHGNGAPYPGVSVGVWSPLWVGAVGTSGADGKFDVPLTNVPFGDYQVAVIKLDTCAQQDGLPTAIQCQRLSNVTKISVTENCNVNRVTELAVTGP